MKNPSHLYGIVAAHYTTRSSSTPLNASLTRQYALEPNPCRVYLIAAPLRLLHPHRPKNRRGSLGHFTSSSGLCSSRNRLLPPCFECKSNPRTGFTSFTTSPRLLPQFQKLLRLILPGFRRRSVPW